MPFDWITFIHREHMNNKPHTEEAKAKMRVSHVNVNKRPETALNRSKGGFTSWLPEKREAHAKAISKALKAMFERERVEQDKRNEINRARVAAFLNKQNGAGRFQQQGG